MAPNVTGPKDVDLDALGRVDELLAIGRLGLGEDRRCRLDGLVADDRAEPRIVVILGLIGLEEDGVVGD